MELFDVKPQDTVLSVGRLHDTGLSESGLQSTALSEVGVEDSLEKNVVVNCERAVTGQQPFNLESKLTESDEDVQFSETGNEDTSTSYPVDPSSSICSDSDSDVCFFDRIPQEIILKIFSYLRPQELCRHVASVCSKWRHLYVDPLLWQEIDLSQSTDIVLICHVIRRFPCVRSLIFSEQLSVPAAMVITDYCTNLENLNLRFSRNVDANILDPFVKKCPRLHSINVEGCPLIDSRAVRTLASAPSLSCLNFSHCIKLVDDDLIYLAVNLLKIFSFNIDGITYITDCSVITLIQHHRQFLTSLVLDGEELTDSSIELIAECQLLTKFSISFSSLLTDQALGYLKELKRLRYLCIKKGSELSSGGFCELFSSIYFSNLTYLNLTDCVMVDDETVTTMAKCCGPSLVRLILSWCWEITDVGLICIIDHCCDLHELGLTGLKRLRGDCLDRIPEDVPHLTLLDLQQCNTIQDTVLYELVRRKVDLKIINYYGQCLMYFNQHVCEDFIVNTSL